MSIQDDQDAIDAQTQAAVDGFAPYQDQIFAAQGKYGVIGDISAILGLNGIDGCTVTTEEVQDGDNHAWLVRQRIMLENGEWNRRIYGGGDGSIVTTHDWAYSDWGEIY